MDTNVREILQDGMDYMKSISGKLDLITDVKEKSEIEKNFVDLEEGLLWIKDVLLYSKELLKLDYAGMSINKQSVQKILDDYSDNLSSLMELFESKKYKELQKYIKDECPKQLKKMLSVYKKVDKTIAEGMN